MMQRKLQKYVEKGYFHIQSYFRRSSRRNSRVGLDDGGQEPSISSVLSARSGGRQLMDQALGDDLNDPSQPIKRSGSKRKKKNKAQPYPSKNRRGSFRRFTGDEEGGDEGA